MMIKLSKCRFFGIFNIINAKKFDFSKFVAIFADLHENFSDFRFSQILGSGQIICQYFDDFVNKPNGNGQFVNPVNADEIMIPIFGGFCE